MAMFEGNWKCSSCGGAITQLPFQPRSESGLTCRTCYAKSKDQNASDAAIPTTNVATDTPDIPDYAEDAASAGPVDDPFEGMEDTAPATPGEKPKVEGSWTCSGCGNAITSLPFKPRSTNNLKCLDCFKKSKA